MSRISSISGTLKDRLRGPVEWLFNEDLMSVLAFLIIPIVGLPIIFDLSRAMLALLALLNYFIVAMFVAEYFLKLYVAESRTRYLLDPWHTLDLLIIILAIADFAPAIALPWGRASPVLRLLRLLRIFTAFGRTVKKHKPEAVPAPPHPRFSRMLVNTMDKSGIRRCVSNGTTCEIARGVGPAWIDIEDISAIDLDAISAAIHVPRFELESKLSQEAFPRIDYFKDYTSIFLWDARLVSEGDGYRSVAISRNGFMIVCAGELIVTLCTGKSPLFDDLVAEGLAVDGGDFAIRVLYALLMRKIRDGEEIVRAMERKTVRLEQLPVGKTPSSFLEDTFYLRKEVLMIVKNLWHLRQVLDSVRTRKVMLVGIKDEHLHMFDIMYDEADYLYETADNLIDSLSSLRELHINTVSYEMTRVMRLLAIITCLALVPSTIGGLLGENILGVPFPINLGEVALIVTSLMVLELYIFYKMGWLR